MKTDGEFYESVMKKKPEKGCGEILHGNNGNACCLHCFRGIHVSAGKSE